LCAIIRRQPVYAICVGSISQLAGAN
jgi:hypothetical protein